ncbi:MAG: hypothetical protein VYC69_03925, partial [Chloroflexota bacterium]|nr:hypothetical protein [Chloroflexota bacterium]
VHSTLTVLENAEIVRELSFQEQSRYDANLSPYANLVCVGWASVHYAKVGQDMVSDLRKRLKVRPDFQFSGQRGDFYDWCPNCANRRDHQPN